MTPAVDTRQTTSAIVTALTTAVQSVQYNAAAAFERVEFFDAEKLVDAFQYLLITEQRVCVIVPLEERFESVVKQPTLIIKRKLPVLLMISDRVIGSANRKVALLGNANTPGAQGLVDMTIPNVSGLLLSNPGGVLCVPVDSTVMTISQKDQSKLPGRVCIALELECTGGTIQTNVGPAPIL